MSETATQPIDFDHLKDYFQPGKRFWIRTQYINDKGKLIEKVHGLTGDLTYRGYATVANSVFLVFDRVEGTGRKARTEQFAVNAAHCPHIGPVQGQ